MKEQLKKRGGLLAFVGGALLLVALLSLGTTTWATPDQGPENQTVTIPPIKTVDKAVVNVGDVAVYEIELNNPATPPWTWENVVVTDTIDSRLRIYGIMTTQGSVGVDGQDVTVNVGDMEPGTSNTITIYVAVDSGDPGDVIVNRAYALRPAYDPLGSTPAKMTMGIPSYIPLVLKGYSGP